MEFLNCFYNAYHTVIMMELTSTNQWKDEPVIDYINRRCTLSLNYKDRVLETFAIKLCVQGMHWGLLYILQRIKPWNFKELAAYAYDVELSIANYGKKSQLLTIRRKKS